MFSAEIIKNIKDHAQAEYPKESIGYVYMGKYFPCQNIHPTPNEAFRLTYADYISIDKNKVSAVIHSHPDGLAEPTQEDMEFQILSNKTHGITVVKRDRNGVVIAEEPIWWGDDLPIAPYSGRVFIHGIQDCYTLIYDFYRKDLGIKLPTCARTDYWWDKGQDLYLENYEKAGFRLISRKEARRGDIFLAQIQSPRVNHGGIYLGNGLGLHHLANRLSKEDPLNGWQRYITHWLRYTK